METYSSPSRRIVVCPAPLQSLLTRGGWHCRRVRWDTDTHLAQPAQHCDLLAFFNAVVFPTIITKAAVFQLWTWPLMPQCCSFNIFSGLSAKLRLVAKANSERLFQGPWDGTEMELSFLDVGQEGQVGRWAHSGSTRAAHPGRPGSSSHIWFTPRLPWLGNKHRLCSDRNNSS